VHVIVYKIRYHIVYDAVKCYLFDLLACFRYHLLTMAEKRNKREAGRRLFGLRLNEALVIELRHAALDLKTPANQLLEEVIQDWLKKYREKRKESR
jgi:hypothetical protein